MKATIKILGAIVVSIILMTCLHTHGRFILSEYILYYLWFIPPILWIVLAKARHGNKPEQDVNIIEAILGVILFLSLLLALCSSLLHHRWFYFLEWEHAHVPEFHYFKAGIIQFLFLTQLLIPLFLYYKGKISSLMGIILICSQALCLIVFFQHLKGNVLYQDDCPCFMYRIWGVSRTFPHLVNYSPYWNAGFVDRSPLTTGAYPLGILFWPLWRILPIEHSYGYVIAVLFIVLIPLLYVFSTKTICRDWTAAWCAGFLSLGVSQYFFLWLLQYGTSGALLSSAVLVPFATFVFRVIWLDKREWWLAIAIVLTALLLVSWPLGVIMGFSVMVSVIISFRKWTLRNMLFLGLCFIGFLAFYSWILAIFVKSGILQGAVQGTSSNGGSLLSIFTSGSVLKKAWCFLGAHIKEGHPILIFLGLGGIFFLPQRSMKYWYMPILFIMMLITGFGKEFNPDLQLYRMAIPMFFVAIIPASLWFAQINNIKNMRFALMQSALAALLILGGWNCVKMYNNHGFSRYITMPPEIKDLIVWIKENTPEGGRILFAGDTVHAYGHGHVAFLPYLTEREMIASDYSQFSFRESPPSFPPQEFLETKEDLFHYMELYNITHIITYKEEMKEVFRTHPDQYAEEITISDKTVFSAKHRSTMFLKGSGSVTVGFNLLKVDVDNPLEEAVIKYNWVEELSVQNPVGIFPFDAGHNIKFIGIHPNGQKRIYIRLE